MLKLQGYVLLSGNFLSDEGGTAWSYKRATRGGPFTAYENFVSRGEKR